MQLKVLWGWSANLLHYIKLHFVSSEVAAKGAVWVCCLNRLAKKYKLDLEISPSTFNRLKWKVICIYKSLTLCWTSLNSWSNPSQNAASHIPFHSETCHIKAQNCLLSFFLSGGRHIHTRWSRSISGNFYCTLMEIGWVSICSPRWSL